MEDAGAAVAEQRLDDQILVLVPEILDFKRVAGDQCRRHDPFEMRHQQLFRRVAHAHRVVHHQGLGVDMLKQMGGGNVRHVEGRVLAHQDNVHIGQIDRLAGAQMGVVAGHPLHH